MPRMRTVTAAYAALKQDDPECCISKQWIYEQVRTGALHHHAAGRRMIINYDHLVDLLANPPVAVVNDNFKSTKMTKILAGRGAK